MDNNSRSWNEINVIFVGKQKAAKTKSFPSLLLLCACERNIKYQTDQERVLPCSDKAQTQLIMEI